MTKQQQQQITTETWATKYRPRRFSDIVGQDAAVSDLRAKIKTGEIPNALLITGPYGCGKTTLSRMFAMYVNCEKSSACGKCASCLHGSNHPDISELDSASEGGIEDVRALIKRSRAKPMHRMRFFIVDEVHRLTGPAASAILKTLEEPSASTCFILCTNEPQKLPDTVLSRCSHLALKLPTSKEIVMRMTKVLELAKNKLPEKVLTAVAEASGGHVRNAMNLLQSASQQYRAGQKDVDKLIVNIGGGLSPEVTLIASKLLLGLYLDKTSVAASAILDHQNSGEGGIPFMNMCLRLNEYVLASRVSNSAVWHTPDNRKFLSLVNSKAKDTKTAKLLRVEAMLADARGKLQYSGAPERSVMLGILASDLSKK